MNQTFTLKEKIKKIFVLFIPIFITQMGMFAMVIRAALGLESAYIGQAGEQ